MLPFRVYVVADLSAAGGEDALRAKLRAMAEVTRELAVYARGLDDALAGRIAAELPGIPVLVGSASRLVAAVAGGVHRKAGDRDGARPAGLLARSIHSVEEARAAREEGCDFAVFGHVYATPSKGGVAPRGLDALRAACEAAGAMPVFAIGGVTVERVAEVRAAGAWGVAVIRGLLGVKDPAAAMRLYLAALQE